MKQVDLSITDIFSADNLKLDRFVKEKERLLITKVSRPQAFQLERNGEFPLRRRISNRSVAWLLSELLEWVNSRSTVISETEKGALQ
ncbi:AlpA family transcriptional regulator [Shewanella electrodiphila]|uniref:AlpA family transcriptional regulator n=1 Tax=Shewanella electrodiphila TaxID=934143 RepID=A0ABT0KUK8_9GAMM|nr:AlpA family phage regulatory protein [Shewanella electrodiphila]MCL1047530.1 AlpA family transcriptional regulator [Shewanella electrodiphila]